MTLDVRHLRLVAAVVDTGSVTAAARVLHLSQPALSHQLRDVEERLGTELFQREGRRMVLTGAGQRVLEAARKVMAEVEAAEADVARLAHTSQGILRLATECYTAYHWLPAVLRRFSTRHPQVEVRIAVEATRRPVEALLAGTLDLGIVSAPTRHRRLAHAPLFEDELVAVMAPEHPLASRGVLQAADFAREHVLLYSIPLTESTLFQQVLTPAGVSPARVSHVELTEALVELTKAGLGISVLARWAVAPELSRGTLVAVRVTRKGLRRHWHAVWPRAVRPTPHLTSFVELLAKAGPPGR
ncbi:LysR family transcriptional regulator [Myxococcus sp. CA056]|uniref:LysR family transcriptional regulator n=1 Tax=Myxococcus sp. CA056 TaxID=2741740 RepID=UPI00157B7AA3|nr:LysR substrate-binding domain-containing protein [Myxococcus sp. CA056]NTX15592.1 LysR family transcriptional regulator [Myxococcus sp. CA056]